MRVKRNSSLGPSTARARKRRLWLVRFYIVLFFLIIILITTAILSGHNRVIIKDIQISGNGAMSTDDLRKVVDQDLSGRYFYLYAKNNFLIFPRFQIARHLLAEFKTLKAVNVDWQSWQTISITVTERSPHSVWCGDDHNKIEQKCFFVDKTGYIYSEAPTFFGSLFVKNYSVINKDNPIDQNFLPITVYEKIFSLIDLLDRNNLKVRAVSYLDYDFKFYLETGPIIIFNDRNDFTNSFQNLFVALKSGDLDLINKASEIDYVDLRITNKIVVGKKK